MEKMTYVAALNYVLTNCELPTDVSEKLTALCAAQVKRNSAEKKPSAKQVANAGVKSAITGWMEHGVTYDAATIAKTCPACEGMSVNKVSALLTQLGKEGVIAVSEDKRKHFYTLA